MKPTAAIMTRRDQQRSIYVPVNSRPRACGAVGPALRRWTKTVTRGCDRGVVHQPVRRAQGRLRGGPTGGFTLVEVMVATGLAAIIGAAVLTTYVVAIRSFQAISNYAEIHADGRLAIDYFSKDIRAVSAITSFSASNLVVRIPIAFNASGIAITNKTVTYAMSGDTLYRTDSAAGNTIELATNIYELRFALYDKVGNSTTLTSIAKGVQLDIKLRKSVISQYQTEDFLSARLDMRNLQ